LRYRYLPLLTVAIPLTLFSMIACNTVQAAERTAMFADFIAPNGAITVFAHGDYVEPYTAIKALLIAHRLGVDVSAPASTLVHWLLAYQQANGPFPRICRSGSAEWLACGPADADDSLAVFWCTANSEILPDDRTLDASCRKSLENLATLWNPQLSTFRALFGQPVAYFADNVEVIGALDWLRLNKATAARYASELAKLPSRSVMMAALSHNYGFHPERTLEPQRASLPATPYAFYPYAVAPVYTWLYDLDNGPVAIRNWALWKKRYGRAWLKGETDHFPWGLIAVAAYKLGDLKTAEIWLGKSADWRQQGRWNVLEEGVRIGLENVVGDQRADR